MKSQVSYLKVGHEDNIPLQVNFIQTQFNNVSLESNMLLQLRIKANGICGCCIEASKE